MRSWSNNFFRFNNRFLKLQGIMSGSPILFKGQHPLNAIILISIIVLIYLLCSTQSYLFWILLAVSFLIGFLLIIPIEEQYASCNFYAKLIFWLGCCRYWIYFKNTALIITGALVDSGAILSYIM